jgi:hypothetical protein
MRGFYIGCWLFVWAFTFRSSDAMEFKAGTWKGHPAIVGDGLIIHGDASSLAKAAGGRPLAAHGHRLLLLNSPGGSVEEAIKVSQEIDRFKIHTIVPRGASCQSACGAILFVAGDPRTVEEGGELGLHTCYHAQTGIPLPECNEIIAQHALANGVSHGSVKAGMDYTAPDKMLKFTRSEAECYGIARYAGSDTSGFDRIEPCIFRMITGRQPPAQAAWRIDLEEGGFSAFVRTVADYDLSGEIKVSCRESDAGKLYFTTLITGAATQIRNAIQSIEVKGLGIPWKIEQFEVMQRNIAYAAIQFRLPADYTMPFLTRTTDFELLYKLVQPYEPIVLRTSLATSRKNLIFAANHCSP